MMGYYYILGSMRSLATYDQPKVLPLFSTRSVSCISLIPTQTYWQCGGKELLSAYIKVNLFN